MSDTTRITPVQVGRLERAFTLIELLVVIAIISILASLLLPTVSGTKEKSRRIVCVSTERQFIIASHVYATDNNDFLPKAGTDNYNGRDTHTAIFSTLAATNFLRYMPERVIDCPNLHETFKKANDWRNQLNYGIAIGYHYLGGQSNTPWSPPVETTNGWISPQKANDNPELTLVADLNIYAYSFERILAPHTANGPVVCTGRYFSAHPEAQHQTPGEIGGKGGNVGQLNGSARWKPMKKMTLYRSSQLWDDQGSFGYW